MGHRMLVGADSPGVTKRPGGGLSGTHLLRARESPLARAWVELPAGIQGVQLRPVGQSTLITKDLDAIDGMPFLGNMFHPIRIAVVQWRTVIAIN